MNNLNMKKKLIYTFILAVYVPVIIVGIILTNGMKNQAVDIAVNDSLANVKRIRSSVTEVLKAAKDVSDLLATNGRVISLATEQYTDMAQFLDRFITYRKDNDFQKYLTLYKKELQNIYIYDDNETIINSDFLIKISDEIKSGSWYQKVIENGRSLYWDYVYNESFSNPQFAINVKRPMFMNGSSVAIISIDLNMERLNSLLAQENFDAMIVNSKGFVVAAKNATIIGENMETLGIPIEKYNDLSVQNVMYLGKKSKLIPNSCVMNGTNGTFRIISIFPIDGILQKANKAVLFGCVIIFCSLILSIILIIVFSDFLSRRIKMISKEMHRAAEGDFEFNSSITGKDEIGELARDLDTMKKGIKDLIYEVYEVNLQRNQLTAKQKEIQLNLLASKINPHFMFNMMESIRMEVFSAGLKDLSKIIQTFSCLIRRSLEAGKTPILLGEELNLLEGYLEIQKFRFGNRMEYEINVLDDVADCYILPMLLQPIVENAVIHGIEGMVVKGQITINIEKKGRVVVVIVQDNGAGIDEDSLNNILASMGDFNNESSKHIGVRNVHQRIKLFYGNEYGVSLESASGKGTKVSITIPWRSAKSC